jgi:hypothetical protein
VASQTFVFRSRRCIEKPFLYNQKTRTPRGTKGDDVVRKEISAGTVFVMGSFCYGKIECAASIRDDGSGVRLFVMQRHLLTRVRRVNSEELTKLN